MTERKVIDGLVSIIMPSWNTERFIAETIQSVLDQTYTNWELIIVDETYDDVYQMAGFIKMMEENTGEKIADLQEIAKRRMIKE